MEIKIETYEVEHILELYLKNRGCTFQNEFSTIENRSSLVRFIESGQENEECSFKAFVVMPVSFKIQDGASDG